jgi:hypothetical protein
MRTHLLNAEGLVGLGNIGMSGWDHNGRGLISGEAKKRGWYATPSRSFFGNMPLSLGLRKSLELVGMNSGQVTFMSL